MRGGASRILFFLDKDLPVELTERNHILQRALGSPDRFKNQVDGIGGASPATSKIAIVSKSVDKNFDITVAFAEVSIEKPIIDYSLQCTESVAAAGLFAVQEGLTNANRIKALQLNGMKPVDVNIFPAEKVYNAGVSFKGIRAEVTYHYPESIRGSTTNACHTGTFAVSGQKIKATLINISTPIAIVQRSSISDRPFKKEDIESNDRILDIIELLRIETGLFMQVAATRNALQKSSSPKICLVDGSQNLKHHDIRAACINKRRMTETLKGDEAISLAYSSVIEGTVVNELCPSRDMSKSLRILHPSGLVLSGAEIQSGVIKSTVQLSSRRIFKGQVYLE